jgi:hypothetical protein
MSTSFVALDPQLIRRVQGAYLDARHRGALDHTAFDAAVLAVVELTRLDTRQARSIAARIIAPASENA